MANLIKKRITNFTRIGLVL